MTINILLKCFVWTYNVDLIDKEYCRSLVKNGREGSQQLDKERNSVINEFGLLNSMTIIIVYKYFVKMFYFGQKILV